MKKRNKIRTRLNVNASIVGEPLEEMILKLKEGEGVDAIEDRDLVYNDGEASTVNPITDIRMDKRGLMLDEILGYQEYIKAKGTVPKEEEMEDSNIEE